MEEHGKAILPFEMNHLPDFYRKKAEIELHEKPEIKTQALKELKDILKKENNIICDIDFEDDFLLRFLRHRKFDIARAHKQVHNFVLLWKKLDKLFKGFYMDDLTWKSVTKYCTVLPKRCPDGCTVVLFELGKWNPDEISFEDFKRLGIALFYQVLRDPMTQINGFKIIHDFTNASVKRLKYCNPKDLYLLYYGGIDCFPGRYKEIHLVNDSIVLKTIWAITNPFIGDKIRKRIFFHSQQRELLDYFPRSILPPQYGGDLKEYYMDKFLNQAVKEMNNSTYSGESNYY